MSGSPPKSTEQSELLWWKKTTVYQIYPRSYQDSNRDGIGDLQGIISRLDYIKDLGVETIWFSPFFKSPQQDFGYDISDYTKISPEYGTMEDCEQLISETHDREMKIVFDLVLNHTSDQHPWFKESRSNRNSPKRNWYVWRDGRKPNGKAPPNNWQSMTSGSGWHYDRVTDQWYWAAFLPCQPDLNYRNPEVKEAMFGVMRFWLDKGVDGFRLDIIGSIYEDPEFKDNPRTWQFLPTSDERGMLFRSAEMTLNHPDNYEFVKELRTLVDSYDPPRFLVGEVFGDYHQMVKYCGGREYDGLHSVFLFQSMEAEFSKKGYQKLIADFERNFSPPLIPTWVFSNHDRYRNIKQLDNNREKAKLQAALQLTMRGVPYIYYGEEIGMEQVNIPFKESKDAVSFRFKKFPNFITKILMKLTDGAIHRDGCRTPMQWDSTVNAGFSNSSETWLPVGESYPEINVMVEMENENSVLHCYQRFLRLRSNHHALNSGVIRVFDNPEQDILIFQRRNFDESLMIIANFHAKPREVNWNTDKSSTILASTYFERNGKEIELNTNNRLLLLPYELVVFN